MEDNLNLKTRCSLWWKIILTSSLSKRLICKNNMLKMPFQKALTSSLSHQSWGCAWTKTILVKSCSTPSYASTCSKIRSGHMLATIENTSRHWAAFWSKVANSIWSSNYMPAEGINLKEEHILGNKYSFSIELHPNKDNIYLRGMLFMEQIPFCFSKYHCTWYPQGKMTINSDDIHSMAAICQQNGPHKEIIKICWYKT